MGIDIEELLDYIKGLQQINEQHRIINGELRAEIKEKEETINEIKKLLEKCEVGRNESNKEGIGERD